MTNSTITTDIHQSLNVKRNLAAQVTFYLVLCTDDLTDLSSIVIRPVTDLLVLIDTSLFQNLG